MLFNLTEIEKKSFKIPYWLCRLLQLQPFSLPALFTSPTSACPNTIHLMQPCSIQQSRTTCMRESEYMCVIFQSKVVCMFKERTDVYCWPSRRPELPLQRSEVKKPPKWSLNPMENRFNPRIKWGSWGKEHSPLLLFGSHVWAVGVMGREQKVGEL